MIIFEKEYDGESLCDLNRDVSEAFDADFNPIVSKIPTDKYGIQLGKFKVVMMWSEE